MWSHARRLQRPRSETTASDASVAAHTRPPPTHSLTETHCRQMGGRFFQPRCPGTPWIHSTSSACEKTVECLPPLLRVGAQAQCLFRTCSSRAITSRDDPHITVMTLPVWTGLVALDLDLDLDLNLSSRRASLPDDHRLAVGRSYLRLPALAQMSRPVAPLAVEIRES